MRRVTENEALYKIEEALPTQSENNHLNATTLSWGLSWLGGESEMIMGWGTLRICILQCFVGYGSSVIDGIRPTLEPRIRLPSLMLSWIYPLILSLQHQPFLPIDPYKSFHVILCLVAFRPAWWSEYYFCHHQSHSGCFALSVVFVWRNNEESKGSYIVKRGGELSDCFWGLVKNPNSTLGLLHHNKKTSQFSKVFEKLHRRSLTFAPDKRLPAYFIASLDFLLPPLSTPNSVAHIVNYYDSNPDSLAASTKKTGVEVWSVWAHLSSLEFCIGIQPGSLLMNFFRNVVRLERNLLQCTIVIWFWNCSRFFPISSSIPNYR